MTTTEPTDLVPTSAALPVPAQSGFTYSFEDVQRMAAAIVKGGLFQQYKTPEQALSLMLLCQAKGLHPMVAVERYDVIQGRPAMKTTAILAEFQKSGGRVQWHEATDEHVSGTFTYPQGGEITITWDKQRAIRAKLWNKDNWQAYPQQMMRARCVAEAVRAIAPGVLSGIYSEEEVKDMPPASPINVTPSRAGDNRPAIGRNDSPRQIPAPPTPEVRRAAGDFMAQARRLSLDVLNEKGEPDGRKALYVAGDLLGMSHPPRELDAHQWAEAASILAFREPEPVAADVPSYDPAEAAVEDPDTAQAGVPN